MVNVDAQVTARRLRTGRPRQRLAGFGSRPLLHFIRHGRQEAQGSGPQNRQSPVRIRPVSPLASWRNEARDPSKVQVRVRLPARLRFRELIWGRGETGITGRSHRPVPGAAPGGSTSLFAGIDPPALALAGPRTRRGRGPSISGRETEETKCWIVDPVEAGSSPVAAAGFFAGSLIGKEAGC
jgi:hypothetical protein